MLLKKAVSVDNILAAFWQNNATEYSDNEISDSKTGPYIKFCDDNDIVDTMVSYPASDRLYHKAKPCDRLSPFFELDQLNTDEDVGDVEENEAVKNEALFSSKF
ncbi:uncharacterized protein LOC136095668 [Hydra vulgaris]|uniref:uncharacterized protein LOC136095668 n=1 Tax=Hydra vulgaris TaxID=6087 RepID=UPI0032E9C3F2